MKRSSRGVHACVGVVTLTDAEVRDMTTNHGPEYFEHEGSLADPTSPELLDDLADDEPLDDDPFDDDDER